MSDVTRILSAIEGGDPTAAGQLLPLVYDELRKLAARRLTQGKPGQTLQATALVHEAYLRLVDVGQAQHFNGRGPTPGRRVSMAYFPAPDRTKAAQYFGCALSLGFTSAGGFPVPVYSVFRLTPRPPLAQSCCFAGLWYIASCALRRA